MKHGNPQKTALLLKRLGMFSPRMPTCRVWRAFCEEDFAAAYRLAHDVFVERGYMRPDPQGVLVRATDAAPDTATFVCELDGEIVGTITAVKDSEDLGLTSDEDFQYELNRLRDANRSVCELTKLAVRDRYVRTNVFTSLCQACYAQAVEWECDDIFTAVAHAHTRFFDDILGFEPLGKACERLDEKGAVLQPRRIDLHTIEDHWKRGHDGTEATAFLYDYFVASNPFPPLLRPWEARTRDAYHDPALLRELFVEQSGLMNRCTTRQLEALHRRWGNRLFSLVYDGPTKSWQRLGLSLVDNTPPALAAIMSA